jgi:hypothetical protein
MGGSRSTSAPLDQILNRVLAISQEGSMLRRLEVLRRSPMTRVMLLPVTTTLEPFSTELRDTRLDEVDHVIALGALAGYTVAPTVAVVWPVIIDGSHSSLPFQRASFPLQVGHSTNGLVP